MLLAQAIAQVTRHTIEERIPGREDDTPLAAPEEFRARPAVESVNRF